MKVTITGDLTIKELNLVLRHMSVSNLKINGNTTITDAMLNIVSEIVSEGVSDLADRLRIWGVDSVEKAVASDSLSDIVRTSFEQFLPQE